MSWILLALPILLAQADSSRMALRIGAGVILVIFLGLYLLGRKKIYPHTAMVLVALVPAILSLVLVFVPDLTIFVAGVAAVLGVLCLLDLLTVPRRSAFSAERQASKVASLGARHPVTLTINNHSDRTNYAWIRDDTEAELHAEPEQFLVRLAPHSRATVQYVVRSSRRGTFTMRQVYLRTRSRFGLWQRHLEYPAEFTVYVYPDMKQLSQYAVLARLDRLNLLGMRTSRRIGQENEFERLRDYTVDDNYKHIDWRSTARRNKLTVKDFQANQSQRIIFLVDCGRMMTNQSAGLSFLDHAFNAMLMLSYVALTHGDSVGLVCFSDEIHDYVPPKGGKQQMNRLLHASFDRFPHLVESRYDRAFLYLGAHCRKRSLVVLITNVVDEVNGFAVEQYLSHLVGRHLPLGVLLRDRRLFDLADAETGRDASLFHAAAAADILSWRHQVLTDLESKGVLLLDVFPEDLTAPLINRYVDLKARHLL